MTSQERTLGTDDYSGLRAASDLVRSVPGTARPLLARGLGSLLLLAGLVHLLAPGLLLRTAAVGYGRVLDVEFDPNDGAPRRVRALGIGMVAVGAHLIYHGGLVPAADGW